MRKSEADFFNDETARHYDERNGRLSDISNCLHFLIRLILKNLPVRSRILCVGVGTGAEILSLSKAFTEWTFVAVDPSISMLKICRDRLSAAGVEKRCELVHGYCKDLPLQPEFDAALSVLVAHFVERENRLDFFRQMTERLKSGGHLINAEIGFDLDSKEFPAMLKNWEAVQTLMGATTESLASLPNQLRNLLTILPHSETESLIRQSGIDLPIRFFQALMVSGWHGKKV